MMERSEMMKQMRKDTGGIERDKDGGDWEGKREKEKVEKVISKSDDLDKCEKSEQRKTDWTGWGSGSGSSLEFMMV